MESRFKILGHPVHPMLIVFPLGLFIAGLFFDIIHLITGSSTWAQVAYWDIIVGVVMGLVAALPGFVDWLAVPSGTRAKSLGALHGLGNVVVVVLFLVSRLLRTGSSDHAPSGLSVALEVIAILIGAVTAWIGGELVYRLGVGVDRDAGLDASSSLSGRGRAGTGSR